MCRRTVNTGSYFKTLFTGKTVTISFDTSLMVNPVSCADGDEPSTAGVHAGDVNPPTYE